MELFTERTLIRSVASRWYDQYKTEIKTAIYEALKSLDLDTATAGEIERIIGNSSWTVEHCDECDGTTFPMVRIGQEPDYDSATALVCLECLKKAVSLCA